MAEFLRCSYASQCSGCDWITKPASEQRELKLNQLYSTWVASGLPAPPDIEWVEVALGGLRDRVDLMIDSRQGSYRLGLFDCDRSGILDLESCPQLSPALEQWLKEFRRHPIRVARGSVRLRVAPDGRRGVWLDLANIDVKMLLDERTTLDALREVAIVEIGQRRKRLVEREGQLKLADPVLEPWFETYVANGAGGGSKASAESTAAATSDSTVAPSHESAVPLYCTIGSFTQPGFRANRALVAKVREAVAATGARRTAEFGSGIGNFTLPLASVSERVQAYEVDGLALEGLRRSAADRGLTEKIEIHEGNFQVERKQKPSFSGLDLILVDPPRSGLMKFLDPLEALPLGERPANFVYVSCFAESFVADTARLLSMGYRPARLAIVDQFPQSRHYEIVASFTLG